MTRSRQSNKPIIFDGSAKEPNSRNLNTDAGFSLENGSKRCSDENNNYIYYCCTGEYTFKVLDKSTARLQNSILQKLLIILKHMHPVRHIVQKDQTVH